MTYAGRLLAGVAVLLAVGACAPDDSQVGMAPRLSVSTPSGAPATSGYWGANWGAHWDGVGVDVGIMSRSSNQTVVPPAATPWIGWVGTYVPQEMAGKATVWAVLKPGLGIWTWSDSPEHSGLLLSLKAGFGCHLNDYTTFGVEYATTQLFDTHGAGNTSVKGLNFTYSLKF